MRVLKSRLLRPVFGVDRQWRTRSTSTLQLATTDTNELEIEHPSQLHNMPAAGHPQAIRTTASLGSATGRMAVPVRMVVFAGQRVTDIPRRLAAAKRRHGTWIRLASELWAYQRRIGLRCFIGRLTRPSEHGATNGQSDPIGQRIAEQLQLLAKRFGPAAAEAPKISSGPLISLLMPTYKTPLGLLRHAIESVMRQTYQNWELCVADDGSGEVELELELRRFAERESRIKLVVLPANGGISAATNAALKLATGKYVGLLDHDDEITYDALEKVAAAVVADPQIDVLYSDECKISAQGAPLVLFPKPDWSPLLMLSCMYIGHLTIYERELIITLGGFRSNYDLSQDYDLALRATERARKIGHVAEVIYGWRAIATSGASGGKPQARIGNIAALQDAARRRGWDATALALPACNHLQWAGPTRRLLVSIIVPSDNLDNILAVLRSLEQGTAYPNWEAIVVTNSGIVETVRDQSWQHPVRFVRFDEAFNFSRKCNVGARDAGGQTLIFLNDDIRVAKPDWLDRMLEVLRLDGIGAVGPKMIYENGTIQHAGMVTGVRGLVGTAFHALPQDTAAHYNFAQSIREVSLLCGACLAVSATLFEQVGGFDEVNTPIYHSDVDLCFRIRDQGFDLAYTPHATLIHIGHMSLAANDARVRDAKRVIKDKANIFLLRRWADKVAADPYYTKSMREILYHDSPEYFEIFPAAHQPSGGRDVLLLTHDLTESGAPRVLLEMAKALVATGHFVVAASPLDGEIRAAFQAAGVTVIVDERVLTGASSVRDFGKDFDLVIANTAATWADVLRLSDVVDVFWYIHEISLLHELADRHPNFSRALQRASRVWAGSKLAADQLASLGRKSLVLEYGIPECLPSLPKNRTNSADRPLRLSVFASYEPRKGQDLLAEAFAGLKSGLNADCRLSLYGRVLDPNFHRKLQRNVENDGRIFVHENLSHAEYFNALFESDLVIVPSRDDTLPLVSLNALSAGIPLVCTRTTGTSAYIEDGVSGFIAHEASVAGLRDALERALSAKDRWPDIAASGRTVFDHHFSSERFAERFSDEVAETLAPDARQNHCVKASQSRSVTA
jgi:GT2 family glycosyltransferase